MESNDRPKTIIGEDVEITGSIKSESNIQLDGKLNGDMTCAGSATIGNTSVIKGNLTVECVTVYGQISGNIVAKDKIEMKSTARINGDIRARRLTVEDGVTFVGKADVNPAGVGGQANRAAAAAAAADTKTAATDDSAVKSDDGPKSGIFRR
jgi:cytoskeletal protein CcmA (bactofilin family)